MTTNAVDALRRAEAIIAAYQYAWFDKQAPWIGQIEPHTAKLFLKRARDDLLAYRPQANRFVRAPKR